MPTKSYICFKNYNLDTVMKLRGTYDLIRKTRGTKGRAAFDHIMRSGIVFLASAFEVYIEDVVNECCNRHIKYSRDATKLPNKIKSTICSCVKNPMELCDEGWRNSYRKFTKLQTDHLNSPKVENIQKLFYSYIGISKDKIANISNINKLDDFIALRGQITHRIKTEEYISIAKLNESIELIENVVKSIDKTILEFFKTIYPNEKNQWRNTYT